MGCHRLQGWKSGNQYTPVRNGGYCTRKRITLTISKDPMDDLRDIHSEKESFPFLICLLLLQRNSYLTPATAGFSSLVSTTTDLDIIPKILNLLHRSINKSEFQTLVITKNFLKWIKRICHYKTNEILNII